MRFFAHGLGLKFVAFPFAEQPLRFRRASVKCAISQTRVQVTVDLFKDPMPVDYVDAFGEQVILIFLPTLNFGSALAQKPNNFICF